MSYDLIVLGGGPAGYVGAIRAAQLGKKVACVENDRAGGTCLNWGCIPTKALLKNAGFYRAVTKQAREFGVQIDGDISFDWEKVIGRSRQVSGRLAGGVEFLFKKNGIDYIRGLGSLMENGKVQVVLQQDDKGPDSSSPEMQILEGRDVLIATGCKAAALPFLPFDGKRILSSKEAMTLSECPGSIAIIGAGAIGVEFASFFSAFGSKVTLIEMMDRLVPVEDAEISATLEKSFKRQGITCLTGHKTASAIVSDDGVELTLESVEAGGETKVIEADYCLVATGVSPVLPEISAEVGEMELSDKGFIRVDARYQTTVPNVYAAGDIIGAPWLAHVASFEAIQAIEGLYLGGHQPKKVGNFPGCTYCYPEIASIGMSEQDCIDGEVAHKIGKFPFMASGRALAANEREGFTKLIFADDGSDKLLGAHIIGGEATEMIAETGLALQMGATWKDIENTIHAHPTYAEALHEASGAAFDHAIHI
ncbi:MAG: dihydrolipoyl dehydrogenase [Verrucomicrobia bacterium]|nr:dihydrolipoyl dehydrogenase [Verrucomicrobiota bacterium]